MPKTLAQIQKQIAQLEEQARAIRQREISGVVARIQEAISHYGLSAADLGFAERRKPGRPAKAATAKPARKKRGHKATAGEIRFRDEQGHTWSGHGRRPKWYLDAIAAGKTKEDLAA